MSLYGNEPRDEAARQDDRLVDNYVRLHFHLDPDEAPAPGQDESGQPNEDEQFDAYMRTHFPGRA